MSNTLEQTALSTYNDDVNFYVVGDGSNDRRANFGNLKDYILGDNLTAISTMSPTGFIWGNGSEYVTGPDSAARSAMGLGSIATQNSNDVSITGGEISGITDLAIADGGTGASDASGARTNLGLVIGTDVQVHSSHVDQLISNSKENGRFVMTDGSTYVSYSPATAKGFLDYDLSDFGITASATALNYCANVTSDIQAQIDAIDGGLTVETGITASTTQTQGQRPLTANINVISTVANENDVVTLPAPSAGAICIISNDGFNTLQIYPSSGTTINGNSGSRLLPRDKGPVQFIAINSTSWIKTAGTVAEMDTDSLSAEGGELAGISLSLGTQSGITASTTQSQGEQSVYANIIEVSTVANANDVITLDVFYPGRKATVINNGANILQIFPSTGSDLGQGANNSTTLAAGAVTTFVCYSFGQGIEV